MKLSRADHLAWREIEGETFVVDLRRKMVYGLNAAAAPLWEALDGGGELESMARLLTPAGEDVDAVVPPLTAFLVELEELGLITADDALQTNQTVESEPSPGFVPPKVVWAEELRSFGQSCARTPAGGPTCTSGQVFS